MTCNLIGSWWRAAGLSVLITCAALGATDDGLVAHWDFNEGAGDVLHDVSGNGNDGTIHDAIWRERALVFDRPGSFVDFPGNDRLAIAGDVTITAWVKLDAMPFPNAQTNWYLVNCEQYKRTGFMWRINGDNRFLTYRANQPDIPSEVFGKTPLDNRTFYHLALVRSGQSVSMMIDGRRDTQVNARVPHATSAGFTISHPSQPFAGQIDDMRVYDRALDVAEILELYKQDADAHGKDTSWVGKLVVTPFVYPDDGEAILEVNLRGLMPMASAQIVTAELVRAGGDVIDAQTLGALPETGVAAFTFALDQLTPGDYELCALVKSGERIDYQQRVPLTYPRATPNVPSPADDAVAAIAPPSAPPRFVVEPGDGGGFVVRWGGAAYAVESHYTYPNGGANALSVRPGEQSDAEASWRAQVIKVDDTAYRVTASGRFYGIDRRITTEPRRVLVEDTITNLTDDVIGLAFGNQIDLADKPAAQIHGMHKFNPAGYVRDGERGVGIIALDDVYMIQHRKLKGRDRCGLGSDGFALGAGASYTLRWAIYPDDSGDYYDFVNAVRADEGLDDRTVPGCLSIAHAGVWLRNNPPPLFVERTGIAMASSGCVTHIPDDKDVSIEGIEFIEYPLLRAMLRDTYALSKRQFPDMKVMFHIAPSIYATSPHANRFPDSRVINAAGEHALYGTSVGYFSQEKVDHGWGWYAYYPTLDNSFGKALLESVDVMMDQIGVDGIFGDGLTTGYGGEATFDRWDGHSVELDPATHTVKRKFGRVMLLGQDAYVAYVRRINDKGGVVISNGGPSTWTFNKEDVIYTAETGWGNNWCAGLHFAPTVIGLAAPNEMGSQRAIHNDMLDKLEWGALYAYYYGSGQPLSYPAITAKMYPITVTQLRPGIIEGTQRIITSRSGVYGWLGEHDLHVVYVADARGRVGDGRCLTTVDAAGARTRVDLRTGEIAVVVKTPIAVESSTAVNATMLRYDADGIDLMLNGHGPITLRIYDGAFAVRAGATYTAAGETLIADHNGAVSIVLSLDGAMRLRIARVSADE